MTRQPKHSRPAASMAGSRHREVEQYTSLLFLQLLAHVAFGIACIGGPGAAGVVLILWAIYGPGQVINWWVIPLATALMVPLYFWRRRVDRRLNEVKQRLEQADAQAINDKHEVT